MFYVVSVPSSGKICVKVELNCPFIIRITNGASCISLKKVIYYFTNCFFMYQLWFNLKTFTLVYPHGYIEACQPFQVCDNINSGEIVSLMFSGWSIFILIKKLLVIWN